MIAHHLTLLASYKDLFDEKPKEISEYIETIPTLRIVDVISMVLQKGELFYSTKKQKEFIFQVWIPHASEAFKISLIKKIRQKQNEHGDDAILILSRLSCLYCLQYILDREIIEIERSTFNVEDDINLLKVFLLINQEFVNKKEPAAINAGGIQLYRKLHLVHLLPQNEIEQVDLARALTAQVIKSVLLFQFLEKDTGLNQLLELFLAEKGISNWKGYLKKILSFIQVRYIRTNSIEFISTITVTKSETYKEDLRLFDSICQQQVDYSQQDFTALRVKPILKVDEGQYKVLYFPFLIDKIFRTIFFDLNNLSQKINLHFNGRRVKNFRSIYAQEFTENHLVNRIFRDIFSRRRYVQYSGKEIREKHQCQGEPDFYIRNGNKILLVESKDVLINKDVKHSFSYHEIENELYKKFVVSNDKQSKAIRQQLELIKKLLTGKLNFDQQLKARSATYYTMIVVQDPCLEAAGVNWLLQEFFSEELKQENFKALENVKIKPPVLVNLDTLIYYSELFINKKPDLIAAVQGYLDFLKSKNINTSLLSFHYYLRNKLKLTASVVSSSTYSEIIKEIFNP